MGDRSWIEVVVFLLLLGASLVSFCWEFRRIGVAIWQSKPDADFSLAPVWARLAGVAREVLLQTVVIRGRPWPGIAHAVVFWGFCAFGLATIDHLARGCGVRLLPSGSLYSKVLGGIAVAVAVAILGLAIRRFLVQPKWLGAVSRESGLIGLLIFLLMVTYLAGLGIAEDSVLGKTTWWAHTVALLVFGPLLPRSKHLHLVLSPLTVLLRRPGFGKIPSLVGDDDFGLDSGKDLTRLIALQAYSCVECGRCTEHCPPFNTGKLLNPKEVVLGVRTYLNDNGPASTEPLIGRHLSAEAVFQCTTCGACEAECPVGIKHLPILVGLRRGQVNTGKWGNEYGARLFLNLERFGNPMGFGQSERQKFIDRISLPYYDGTQEYCLWLGCMGAYDPRGQRIVEDLVSILRHFAISFGVLRKERCTGDAAHRLGNDYLFAELAQANIEHLVEVGVSKLLSICPHCVHTISEDWKELGARFEILHHSQLLAKLVSHSSGSESLPTAVFHDPCYLGRYRNVDEEPRRVIRQEARLVEAAASRRSSRCCGAGGGLVFLGEEPGRRMNAERARELVSTGASVLVTACPFCQTMFQDALLTGSASPPAIVDIAQLIRPTLVSKS